MNMSLLCRLPSEREINLVLTHENWNTRPLDIVTLFLDKMGVRIELMYRSMLDKGLGDTKIDGVYYSFYSHSERGNSVIIQYKTSEMTEAMSFHGESVYDVLGQITAAYASLCQAYSVPSKLQF